MHLVSPPPPYPPPKKKQFATPLFPVSFGCYKSSQEKSKTMVMQFFFFFLFFGGGGGKGVNKVTTAWSMVTNILNRETRFLCLSQVSETEIYHRLFVPREPSVCLRLRALQGKKCVDREYLFKWQERWNNEHDNIKKLFPFVTIS